MQLMNEEQYENLIALLKKALEFYGNQANYIEKPYNDGLISIIELDEGSQARFALKKVEETLNLNQKLQEDYNKVIGETIDAIENKPINLNDMITTLKNIEND
jgi:outer membrane protein TolC